MIRNLPFAYTRDYADEKEKFEDKPSTDTKNDGKDTPKYTGSLTLVIIIGIFVLLWIVFGIAAFIMSIICFGYSGTTAQHVVGLLLAIFFGPFYWIYFLVVKSYCGRGPSYGGGLRNRRKTLR